ncbi:hypothetical protein EON68_02530, partial [archaeon]
MLLLSRRNLEPTDWWLKQRPSKLATAAAEGAPRLEGGGSVAEEDAIVQLKFPVPMGASRSARGAHGHRELELHNGILLR